MAIDPDPPKPKPRPKQNIRLKLSMPFIILSIALAAFAIGECVVSTSANDLFWQLRTGREIVERHQVPHYDTYSWTSRGTPWIVHEWLSFIVFWKAYQIGHGFSGVWLLQTVLVTVTLLILFSILYRETERAPLAAFILAIGATITASGFFQPRPHLFTYLFLTVTIGLVLPARRNPRQLRRLWVLVPLTMLWANLHAGVLIGVGLLAAFAIGDYIVSALRERSDTGRGPSLAAASHLGIVAAACALATLATPYGWHVYQNFSATLGNSTAMNMVSEWTSPDFHDIFGKLFEGMIGITAFALVGTRLRRDPIEILLIVGLAHAGLTSARNVPLFALIAIPLAARHIQSAMIEIVTDKKNGADASPSLFGAAPSFISVAAVGIAFLLVPIIRVQSTLLESHGHATRMLDSLASTTIALDSFPEGACQFVEAEKFPARLHLYNTYDIGGFLIWRLPGHPVFIDGRADVYFNNTLTESMDLRQLRFDWESRLNRYGADLAIIPAREPEAHLFMDSPNWALVYADRAYTKRRRKTDTADNGLVFLKRSPENAPLIAQYQRDCPAVSGQQTLESMR